MDTTTPTVSTSPAEKRRLLHNWLQYMNRALSDADRSGNYHELLKQVDKLQTQIPEVKRVLIYLINVGGK